MKYQARIQWDNNRPIFLKIGFVFAISLSLMAFNYTTYPTEEIYEPSIYDLKEDIILVPPKTTHIMEKVPPPPSPKINLIKEIEPIDQKEFVEDKPVEVFEDIPEDVITKVSDDVVPTAPPTPEIVPPIIENEEDDSPVIMADRMPVYSDCDISGTEKERRSCTSQKLLALTSGNIKYPPLARQNGIEGTVVASFIVSKKGNVEDINIVRDIGAGCGDEVKRVIKKLGKFYPGKHNGRPVSVIYRIPVKFKLN